MKPSGDIGAVSHCRLALVGTLLGIGVGVDIGFLRVRSGKQW
jgi:hypothetical protein